MHVPVINIFIENDKNEMGTLRHANRHNAVSENEQSNIPVLWLKAYLNKNK